MSKEGHNSQDENHFSEGNSLNNSEKNTSGNINKITVVFCD